MLYATYGAQTYETAPLYKSYNLQDSTDKFIIEDKYEVKEQSKLLPMSTLV
jgi:hypothetical protein